MKRKCPWCGSTMLIVGEGTPSPGDDIVCGRCDELSVFTDTLRLRRGTMRDVMVAVFQMMTSAEVMLEKRGATLH